ncbi:hypothetical protein BDZ45DRAFT_696521 [Acephala macrosclerotiorum]|nr:hypothetical protein BDZ45DRAFT_696521 [Acephala macrosclerotiorum]
MAELSLSRPEPRRIWLNADEAECALKMPKRGDRKRSGAGPIELGNLSLSDPSPGQLAVVDETSPRFNELAKELRLQIWNFTIVPRIVKFEPGGGKHLRQSNSNFVVTALLVQLLLGS